MGEPRRGISGEDSKYSYVWAEFRYRHGRQDGIFSSHCAIFVCDTSVTLETGKKPNTIINSSL